MQIKIIDKNFDDLCYKSIDYLENRVKEYLRNKHNIHNAWFVDSTTGVVDHQFNEIEEIVLFGSFLQRFLESGCWNLKRARFWVLSEQVKKVLVELLNFPQKSINVIPREELVFQFPLKKIDQKLPITFVYSGRLSESKNLMAVIYTIYYLQKESNLNIGLNLYGDFDNVSSIYSTKSDNYNFKNEFKSLIDELDWDKKPVFMGEKSQKKWVLELGDNTILINLSSFICEDFGVSVAQALESGIPCILSEWGGLKDYGNPGFIKIPASATCESTGNLKLLMPRGKAIANFIIENWNEYRPTEKKEHIACEYYLKKSEIDDLRRKFIGKWGYESLYLLRGQANKFNSTEKGKKFFESYFRLFSCEKVEFPKKLIFTSNEMTKCEKMTGIANQEIENSLQKKEEVSCEKIERLMWKSTINKILNANQLIFPHYTKELDKLLEFIGDIRNKKTVIRVYIPKGKIPDVKTEIEMIEIN